jgi:hypothetical protein
VNDFGVDRDPVAVVGQPDQGQQDELLEFAKGWRRNCHVDFLDDVEEMAVPWLSPRIRA